MSKLRFEIEKLKEILLSNGYSNKFINKCISKFRNKSYKKKHFMLTVPKKQLYLELPFMGKMSPLAKPALIRSLHKRLLFCKARIVFKTSNCSKNYFSLKDIVLEPPRFCGFFLRAEAAILHILVITSGTLKSGSLNTKEYHFEQVNI